MSAVQIAPSFHARVAKRGAGDCWMWTGPVNGAGYGQTRAKIDGKWRGRGAHQVAHYLATGRWERAADGRLVRHLCHQPLCCNPAHLRGGTPVQNAFDRYDRLAGRRLLPAANPLRVPCTGWAQ